MTKNDIVELWHIYNDPSVVYYEHFLAKSQNELGHLMVSDIITVWMAFEFMEDETRNGTVFFQEADA